MSEPLDKDDDYDCPSCGTAMVETEDPPRKPLWTCPACGWPNPERFKRLDS